MNHINKLKVEMAKYKEVWSSIRNLMDLTDREDPIVQDGMHDARVSGIWNGDELSEEEDTEDDATVGDGDAEVHASIERTIGAMDAVMGMEDREVHRAPRICLQNGMHGASPGEDPQPWRRRWTCFKQWSTSRTTRNSYN
jgi:hypothetical protein